ncbi:hypothetical protein [Mitsuokella jalaludinii]
MSVSAMPSSRLSSWLTFSSMISPCGRSKGQRWLVTSWRRLAS